MTCQGVFSTTKTIGRCWVMAILSRRCSKHSSLVKNLFRQLMIMLKQIVPQHTVCDGFSAVPWLFVSLRVHDFCMSLNRTFWPFSRDQHLSSCKACAANRRSFIRTQWRAKKSGVNTIFNCIVKLTRPKQTGHKWSHGLTDPYTSCPKMMLSGYTSLKNGFHHFPKGNRYCTGSRLWLVLFGWRLCSK